VRRKGNQKKTDGTLRDVGSTKEGNKTFRTGWKKKKDALVELGSKRKPGWKPTHKKEIKGGRWGTSLGKVNGD